MGVVLEKLVVKILAGIEMTWWESKPEKNQRKSNSNANTRIMVCFNTSSDSFAAKYENSATNESLKFYDCI